MVGRWQEGLIRDPRSQFQIERSNRIGAKKMDRMETQPGYTQPGDIPVQTLRYRPEYIDYVRRAWNIVSIAATRKPGLFIRVGCALTNITRLVVPWVCVIVLY